MPGDAVVRLKLDSTSYDASLRQVKLQTEELTDAEIRLMEKHIENKDKIESDIQKTRAKILDARQQAIYTLRAINDMFTLWHELTGQRIIPVQYMTMINLALQSYGQVVMLQAVYSVAGNWAGVAALTVILPLITSMVAAMKLQQTEAESRISDSLRAQQEVNNQIIGV